MRNPAGRRADNDHRETITSGKHHYINQKGITSLCTLRGGVAPLFCPTHCR